MVETKVHQNDYYRPYDFVLLLILARVIPLIAYYFRTFRAQLTVKISPS